jgi:gluconate 5-dehydrogenase
VSASLFDLRGKVALVTGSTSGLGREMARGLGEAGATIVLNGRNAERLQETVADFRGKGIATHASRFDVTSESAVTDAVAAIERDIGPIDILVNNAGIQRRALITEMSLATWEEVIGHNLTSVFIVGRAVASAMIARKRGKVINICSLTSEVARRTIAPYTASKGGVRQLTRAMCVEWAPYNIQVNGIGPGYFETPLNEALLADAEFNSWVCGRTPAGRWGQPAELIGAAVFLASSASDFVNGQVIYVDGGLLASI